MNTAATSALPRLTPRRRQRTLRGCLTLLAVAVLMVGCPRLRPPTEARTPPVADFTSYLQPRPVGAPVGEQPPWIGHVNTVDLDGDGWLDIIACESQENQIVWLRQTAPGQFTEQVIARDLLAPVRVESADLDGDGDLDLIVSLMGYVFPNNDQIGSLVALENDGRQNFTPRVLLENVARITDARAADLTGDGQLDLVVGHFGYDQGEVRWMERIGPWEFRSHVLLQLSGAMNVAVADFTGDGLPDLVAQISQQWEEIYLFENRGGGRFERRRLWGSSNEDYGSSGMIVGDLNGDGRPDIVFANGDGFGPAVLPGPRPWHGLQWLENIGHGQFRYHRLGDMAGVYSPVIVDLDGDGAMDVVAVSAFIDRDLPDRPMPSLMWFRNDGQQRFEPRVLARLPKDQVTLAVGQYANGQGWLVSGGFYVFPPYRDLSRITVWQR